MSTSEKWQIADIEFQRLPSWYEFSICDDPFGLSLKVHQNVFCELSIFDAKQLAPHLEREFKIGILVTDPRHFGYGEGFLFRNLVFQERLGAQYYWYDIPFPEVEVLAGVCERCDGTGTDEYQDKCISCAGSKQATKHEWTKVYQTCASLLTFFRLTESIPKNVFANLAPNMNVESIPLNSSDSQLMAFLSGMIRNQGGQSFPLGGHFSADFANWLILHCNSDDIENARQAMLNAWREMFIAPAYENDFRITKDSGWLVVQLSGNCFAYPAQQTSIAPAWGYGFTTHYVDSPAHQLVLLAGLVSLWQSARQFYEKLA